MSVLDDLYRSLSQRIRPEDVAELVQRELGNLLDRREADILNTAARGAHVHHSDSYSSMSTEFARPVGLANQVSTARQLFPMTNAPKDEECDIPTTLNVYIAEVSREISKTPLQNDFKSHRLNRVRRDGAGLGTLSKRQYNKRFRLLQRMEWKVETLEREIRKREYALVSKSRLATRITPENFLLDRNSACFIAYLTSRANLRSVFTNGPQAQAYDEIAEMLLDRCRASPSTNWLGIAFVYPTSEVLAKLSQEQLGRLMADWYALLAGIAGLLREVWEKSRFDRATMIVRKGDDSTTWNATAGAWNKARDGWIEVLHAAGMDDILDQLCPGKVLRLMAADVAAWHRASGGGLDPDTAVWEELPPPWQVLDGTATCTRKDVEAACRRHQVDPTKKGWTQPRPDRVAIPFRPTPELVHGVEVSDPTLAELLRKAGVFSGKKLKQPVE
jgi:hypothetical protein